MCDLIIWFAKSTLVQLIKNIFNMVSPHGSHEVNFNSVMLNKIVSSVSEKVFYCNIAVTRLGLGA